MAAPNVSKKIDTFSSKVTKILDIPLEFHEISLYQNKLNESTTPTSTAVGASGLPKLCVVSSARLSVKGLAPD